MHPSELSAKILIWFQIHLTDQPWLDLWNSPYKNAKMWNIYFLFFWGIFQQTTCRQAFHFSRFPETPITIKQYIKSTTPPHVWRPAWWVALGWIPGSLLQHSGRFTWLEESVELQPHYQHHLAQTAIHRGHKTCAQMLFENIVLVIKSFPF